MFKNLKDKALGMMLRAQLKKTGLPQDQQDMLVALILENPDFFKKIQAEVSKKKSAGMNEQAAMMQVMREHQTELQELVVKMQQGKK